MNHPIHFHGGNTVSNSSHANGNAELPMMEAPIPSTSKSASTSLLSPSLTSAAPFPSVLFANSSCDEWKTVEQAALEDKISQLNPASFLSRASGEEAAATAKAFPPTRYLLHPKDGTVVLDPAGRPLAVSRILSTKPLQSELLTRPGPGNKRLTYMSGEGVARLLNEIFGFDGWCLEVKKLDQASCSSDASGKHHVVYTALVRITVLPRSGPEPAGAAAPPPAACYREDVGVGDCSDRQLPTAVAHAAKGAVTDGLKRAARLFGDRLGNSLYDGHFSLKNAPVNLSQALADADQKVAARYDWSLHAQQLKRKQPPAPNPAATAANPVPQPRPPHASGISAPAVAAQSKSFVQFNPARGNPQQQNPPNRTAPPIVTPAMQRPPSAPASCATTIDSLELARRPMALPSNQPVPPATRAGPPPTTMTSHGAPAARPPSATTAAAVSSNTGVPGWQPSSVVPTKPSASSSLSANGNLSTAPPTGPGGSSATTMTPSFLSARRPPDHLPRPTTSSGRCDPVASSTVSGSCGLDASSCPGTSAGSALSPLVPVLPSKRPLERTDPNARGLHPTHPSAASRRPPPAVPPPPAGTAVVKKSNPYHHHNSFSN